MPIETKTTKDIIKLGKYLTEITTIKNSSGKVLHQIARPLMVEFYLKDILQIMVGATILAIPIAFTEEVWRLGQELPWLNIGLLVVVSLIFISTFVYYSYYKDLLSNNYINFAKRVVSTYLLSIIIVALLMTIIQRADLIGLFEISLKRIFIVAFPASMSAVVADSIK